MRDLLHVQNTDERRKLSYSAALMLKKIGEPQADDMIAAAVRVNPWVPFNLNRRGLTALWRHEYVLAEEYSTFALDIDPQDASALAIRAGVEQMRGGGAEARRDMCRALKIGPQDPVALEIVRRLFANGLRCEEESGQQ